MKKVEHCIRVILPSRVNFEQTPDGDNAYESVYDKVIEDSLPPGFKLKPMPLFERYCIDNLGRTIIPIEPINTSMPQVNFKCTIGEDKTTIIGYAYQHDETFSASFMIPNKDLNENIKTEIELKILTELYLKTRGR